MSPRVASAGAENARFKARRLLTRFGVESADHLHIEGFADRLGVDLEQAPLDGARAQLIVWADGRRPRIVLSDRLIDPAERRFAIAHELGHFVLKHPAVAAGALCRPRPSISEPSHRDFEQEADCFAMELLLPSAIVAPLHNAKPMTLDVPRQLAERCRVPLLAGAIRVTEGTERVCAAVLSEHGAIRWVSPSDSFAHAFRRSLTTLLACGRQVDTKSLAYAAQVYGVSLQPCSVPARAWLDVSSHASAIVEHSLLVSESQVLTMLWVPSWETRFSGGVRAMSAMHVAIASDDDITTRRVAVPRLPQG